MYLRGIHTVVIYFAIGMLHKKGKLVSSLSLWFSSECPSVKRVTLGCC